MAAYIPSLSGPIPNQFGAFHHQTPYIPNQTTMRNQFAYNIPLNSSFLKPVHLTPQPIDPNSNQFQENLATGDSEAQSSHGSTRTKIYIMPDGNG